MEVGEEREIINLSLHCHHQNDSCIKMSSDESHFNVSVGSDGQGQRTVSTNHNLSEEKGEPKRYRTEVRQLLLCCLKSSDVCSHIRDKLRPMRELYVHGNQKAR